MTVIRYDSNGDRLESGFGRAVRTTVRYRLDGIQRKKKFSGQSADRDAAGLKALIDLAYFHGWDADDKNLPVAPHGGPRSVAEPTEPTPVAPVEIQIPQGGGGNTILDVEGLVQWQKVNLATGLKKRGGQPVSSKTLTDYEVGLDFFAKFARYGADDSRVLTGAVQEGDSMRLDDPQLQVTEDDLVAFVTHRKSTNMRTRAMNDRRMEKWAATFEKEELAAAKAGRDPVISPIPERQPETASARTIEAGCSIVRRLFHDARNLGKIDYLPWTAKVDNQVVRASPKVRTLKSLLNLDQSRRVAQTLASTTRRGRTSNGELGQVSGERYEVLVELARLTGPREEELAGIRLSWLELDGPLPRLAVRNAEVYERKPGGGRQRSVVPLKQRRAGEVRYVDLSDQPELVSSLRSHVARFVAVPDPTSPDEYRRDPHLFTTELGAPIDFTNWVKSWWKPAVASALTNAGESHLAEFAFGQLRHCAITAWLHEGRTLQWCAEQAGNSVGIIEKHYAGIMAEIRYVPRPQGEAHGTPPVADLADTSRSVTDLSDAELARQLAALAGENVRRSSS